MKRILLGILFSTGLVSAFGQTPELLNAGYESWEEYTSGSLDLERPTDWYGSDAIVAEVAPLAFFLGIDIDEKKQIFKSEDRHMGDFAARLLTADLGDSLGNVPALLSNAQIALDLSGVIGDPDADISAVMDNMTFSGGTPMYGFKVDTVSAWIKTPAGNVDSSAMIVNAMRKTTTASGEDTLVSIGSVTHVIYPTSAEWRQIVFPMAYTGEYTATDTLIVVFVSSYYDAETGTATDGNTLIVDDVNFTYSEGTVSIKEPKIAAGKVVVFPNPAGDQVSFDLALNADIREHSLSIFDLSGKRMVTKELTQKSETMDISSWAPGTYFYKVQNKVSGKFSSGTFVK